MWDIPRPVTSSGQLGFTGKRTATNNLSMLLRNTARGADTFTLVANHKFRHTGSHAPWHYAMIYPIKTQSKRHMSPSREEMYAIGLSEASTLMALILKLSEQ